MMNTLQKTLILGVVLLLVGTSFTSLVGSNIPEDQTDVSSTINDEDEVEFTIDGPTHGKYGTLYPYTFYLSPNPESDVFDLLVWWGQGFGFGYGPFPTGEDIVMYHAWHKDWGDSGTYTIEATARCGNSTYEATLEVTMPVNQQTTYSLFLQFLERFPRMFPILRHLLWLFD